jgi:hypothetical protein
MSIFDDIRAIEFDRNRDKIFRIKSGILWGHSKHTNGSFPLLYISKPKNISQADFELLLDNIDITMRKPE